MQTLIRVPTFSGYISEFLADLRVATGMTQKDVAQNVKISRPSVVRFEGGQRTPGELGYVACVVQIFFDRLQHNFQDPGTVKVQLLTEINKVRQGYFPEHESIQDWNHLCTLAERYRNRHNVKPDIETHRADWGEAPSLQGFYGRMREIELLQEWITVEQCRVICLLGMGGIGKTALAAFVAKKVQSQFEFILWRSLRNAPSVDDFLRDALQFYSEEKDIGIAQNRNAQITVLVELMRAHRCLLILDNIESIMLREPAGQYHDEHTGYADLIHRIGVSEHQSCLLLTSREKPGNLSQLDGPASVVRSLTVNGLSDIEGDEILSFKNLIGSSKARKKLVRQYSGNPLALHIVSDMIREVYAQDIDGFVAEGEPLFDDIEDLLTEQYARLSILEQRIMIWLAIEREPTSRETMLANERDMVTARTLRMSLRSLLRRSFIEQVSGLFTLQNVVMEYVTDVLIQAAIDQLTENQGDILHTHAMLKAQSKTYLRQSQQRLILAPILEKLLLHHTKSEIVLRFQQILTDARGQKDAGYLPGNIANLAIYADIPLQQFDFSNLPVWQVYLQGQNLADVRFISTDLSDSVFSTTLGTVFRLDWSPDGNLLAAATDRDVRIWRIVDNQPVFVLSYNSAWVWVVKFSPDGTKLAFSTGNGMVELWNLVTEQPIHKWSSHQQRVRGLIFHPQGQQLVSGGDDQLIRVWDIRSGELVKTLTGHANAIGNFAFNPDGTILASASSDKTIRVWSWPDLELQLVLEGHTSIVRDVRFDHSGRRLFSCGYDSTIRIWDISSGKQLSLLEPNAHDIRAIDISSDGATLVSGGRDMKVRIWDIATEECTRVIEAHDNNIMGVVFNPKTDVIASGGFDASIKFWDKEGQSIRQLQGFSNMIWTLKFSPDGRQLASGSGDSLVRLWRTEAWEIGYLLKGHLSPIWSLDFSPNGQYLASTGADRAVRLWNAKTSEFLRIIWDTRTCESLQFSPDGQYIATASSDRNIYIWSMDDFQCVQVFEGHNHRVKALCYSQNGRYLASSSEDMTVRVWDIASGGQIMQVQGELNTAGTLAFAPFSHLLVTTNDYVAKVWDIESGQQKLVFEEHRDRLYAMAFLRDRYSIATASYDGTIRIWNISTGKCSHVLEHNNRVRAVASSPTADIIASGDYVGNIRIWNSATGDLLRLLKVERPYERMDITHATGLTETQRVSLQSLGAIEE